jgi:hypothetical protein
MAKIETAHSLKAGASQKASYYSRIRQEVLDISGFSTKSIIVASFLINKSAISCVAIFPVFNHIILGGELFNKLISKKSESKVTIT